MATREGSILPLHPFPRIAARLDAKMQTKKIRQNIKLFLSHASDDKAIVRALATA